MHFFDLESGWLRTVRDLTIAPGPMIRRYVQGHRKVFANPFTYLVFSTAAAYVVQKLFGVQERLIASMETTLMDSPLQMEFATRFAELMMQNTLYISVGVLVPAAVIYRLFFWRSGYNLAECLVFVVYAGGHTSLLSAVLVPLFITLPASSVIQSVYSLTVGVLYMLWASRGFFRGHGLVVALKTTAAYLIAYATFMAFMMVAIMAYIFFSLVPAASGVEWDLVTAADLGVAPVVESLLEDGVNADSTLRRTALHAAAENGDLEILELLLAAGADANLKDVHGRVPLMVALTERHTEAAKRLTQVTDPKVRSANGSTLLIAALRAENPEVARWALDNGVDVNATRAGKRYATALMIAARKADTEMVRRLLDLGADPTVTNRDGKTALDLARGEDVKALLEKAESTTGS